MVDKPLNKWTVAELKAELERRGQETQGVKQVLVDRLAALPAECVEAHQQPQTGEDWAAEDWTASGEAKEGGAEDYIGLDDGPMRESAAEEQAVNGTLSPRPTETQSHPAADQDTDLTAEHQQEVGAPDSAQSLLETDDTGAGQAQEDTLPEWEVMPDIPEHWRPTPLFLVRNIPIRDDVTEEDVQRLVESIPQFKVRSVNFDDRPSERMMGRRSALVRLQPPPLPWKEAPGPEEGGVEDGQESDPAGETPESSSKKKVKKVQGQAPPRDGDVMNWANWAVQQLKGAQPPLQLADEQVAFETGSLQVQLYVGNLSPEWQEDEAFVQAMASYGKLERAFVMRNAAGLSKGYAFVEYALPGSALACKQAMDEIERNMRPDPRKQKEKAAQAKAPQGAASSQQTEDLPKEDKAAASGSGAASDEKKDETQKRAQALKLAGWPEGSGRLVKLLRAEWAIMRSVDVLFSRVLYVANLRTSQGSQKQLKEIFEQFGKVAEVTVPKNKTTNTTKGFAFVAFANGLAADRAYRALEKSGSEEIGGALVSFANSAKHTDMQTRAGGAGQAGSKQPGMPRVGGTAQIGGGRGLYGGRGVPGMPIPGPMTQGGMHVGRMPPGIGRGGFGGRGMGGRGAALDEAEFIRQQQMQMQAGIAAQTQMARQMEMRMQQQMRAQQAQLQAQMQAQLRQAQLQVQQFQQQAAQLQRQAAQAQAKAASEAEARKRAEEEARRAALAARAEPAPLAAKRGPAAQYHGSYSAAPDAPAARSGSAGYSQGVYNPPLPAPAAGGTNPGGRYGTAQGGALASQQGYGQAAGSGSYGAGSGYGQAGGYGSQDYAAGGQAGYGDAYGASAGSYGSQGFGAADYDGSAAAYAAQGGYGARGAADQAGYGQQASYEQQEAYGQAEYGQQAAYGYGAEAGYGADATAAGKAGYGASQAGYDTYSQGAEGAYGTADASGYGQQLGYGNYGQQGAAGAGSKRSNPYQQAGYGAYGAAGSYGAQGGGGDFGKRPRY